MKNAAVNLGAIKKIAGSLEELNKQVVYVGGAVVSLYINDPAADDVRPTKDIDITLQITSFSELEKLRKELVAKGFYQTAEDNVICRFRYEDLKVDVMSTKAIAWAPANPWFEPGFAHLETMEVEGQAIRILSLPYFLATKYTAFKDRADKNPRTSHDLEDITYVLDNRTDLVEVVLNSTPDIRSFLKVAFEEVIENDLLQEAIIGNLYYETQSERFEMIMDKLQTIVNAE